MRKIVNNFYSNKAKKQILYKNKWKHLSVCVLYSSLNTIASTWKSICEPHQKKKSVRTCKTGLKSGGLNAAVRQKLILCSLVYFPSFCTECSCYTAVHFLIKNLQDNITLLYMYSAQRHVFPFCSKLPAVIYSFFTQSESLIALFEPFCFLVRQVYIVVFLFYQCC